MFAVGPAWKSDLFFMPRVTYELAILSKFIVFSKVGSRYSRFQLLDVSISSEARFAAEPLFYLWPRGRLLR